MMMSEPMCAKGTGRSCTVMGWAAPQWHTSNVWGSWRCQQASGCVSFASHPHANQHGRLAPSQMCCHCLTALQLGGSLEALKVLGFGEGQLGGYHAFEVNKDAIAVAKSNHQDITHHSDVRAITHSLLSGIIQQSGPIRLIIGGPPCPNLCLANADRQDVLGEGANLLHYFYIILHHLKVLQPGVSVHFLMENVQGMAGGTQQEMHQCAVCTPRPHGSPCH